jgi:cobalt-zinc-cadmium efflux system membrane fusion protein
MAWFFSASALIKVNVSSEKTFLKAESDYKTTRARYESLKKKLQLMNINPNTVTEVNLRSTIAVKAPISGFVTSVLATKGMFLNPSDIALTIMNTEHMHIELNIYEQDLTNVAIGDEVSFNIQNGHTPYKAEVHLINKAIDPENRTVKVHCHFKDESDALSLTPGMFVEAEIYALSDSSLALPKKKYGCIN